MSPGATAHSNEQHSTWGNESTPEALKERQISMELKVSQIWLVLSGFEESSAACIGDMLRVVNERKLLDVILLAEKFILHVETLFAVIDDLEAQFALAGVKGASQFDTSDHRHVTRKGGQAAVPQAGQLFLNALADITTRRRHSQHAGPPPAGNPTGSLP